MEQVLQRLAAIETKMDDLKEIVQSMHASVKSHGDWISRREPLCQMTCNHVDDVSKKLAEVEDHFDSRIAVVERKLWQVSAVITFVVSAVAVFTDHFQGIIRFLFGKGG